MALSLAYRIAAGCRPFAVSALALLTLIGSLVPAAGAQAAPAQLHVAAAADLQPVLPMLAAAYERQTGVRIVSSFGSSAALTQQLENGDRQDLFLAADFVHPEQLVALGLAAGQPTAYARGVLVLWARKDSPAQPLTLQSLTSPKVSRIAVTNELSGAYGLAATRALARLGLTDRVSPKLLISENITQAAESAESGRAQAGILPLTIASSPRFRELGSYVPFPPSSYPEIRHCAVVLKSSRDQAAAQLFINWLTSYGVQHNLAAFGLDPLQ